MGRPPAAALCHEIPRHGAVDSAVLSQHRSEVHGFAMTSSLKGYFLGLRSVSAQFYIFVALLAQFFARTNKRNRNSIFLALHLDEPDLGISKTGSRVEAAHN